MVNYCLPIYEQLTAAQKSGWDGMVDSFESSFLGSWASDIFKARYALLASILIAVATTLLYILLMHFFANILAWISVALVQIGLMILGYFFYDKRQHVISQVGTMSTSASAMWWSMLVSWVAAGLLYVFLACNF